MLKEPLLFATLMAGGGAFIASAYGAFALDGPGLASAATSDAPPPRAPMPPISIESDGEIEPELIFSEVMLAGFSTAPREAAAVAALRPCSVWREVGAIYQGRSGASGVHQVRGLCY